MNCEIISMKMKKKVAVFFRRNRKVHLLDKYRFAALQSFGYKIVVRDICPKRSPAKDCEYKWIDELEGTEA